MVHLEACEQYEGVNLRASLLTRDRQAGPESCKYLFHIKSVYGTNKTDDYCQSCVVINFKLHVIHIKTNVISKIRIKYTQIKINYIIVITNIKW